MSKNIIRTIGHHTCGKCDTDELLANAPFKSTGCSFLGEGYYFWDNDIETAKWWGEERYKNNYSIVEIELELKGDTFLDLVGSREDMSIFFNLYSKLCKRSNDDKLGFAEAIEKLRLMNKKYDGELFPYTIIRALDVTRAKKRIKFNQNKGCMELDPKIMICFYSKTDLQLDKLKEV